MFSALENSDLLGLLRTSRICIGFDRDITGVVGADTTGASALGAETFPFPDFASLYFASHFSLQ